jgi:hypothetical protein
MVTPHSSSQAITLPVNKAINQGEPMANEDATAVKDQVVADATPTDSAPVETPESEVAEDKAFDAGFNASDDDDSVAEDETDSSEPEAPEESGNEADGPKADETDTKAQPQGEETVDPKNEWEQMTGKSQDKFRQAINERNELRQQIVQLKAQEAQFAQEQELLNEVNPDTGDYYTPQEVERIAFQKSRENQQQQIAEQRYALEIQQNQQTIASEAQRAMQEFPEFDSTSPQYDPELTAQADLIMQQSIITDQNGTVIGANISPYQLYKTIAEPARKAAQKAATIGQAQAQKATEKMLANADTAPGVATKTTQKDPFLEGLMSED